VWLQLVASTEMGSERSVNDITRCLDNNMHCFREDMEREIAWVFLLRGIGRNHQLSFLSNSKLRSSCASFPVRYRATNKSEALLIVRPMMTEFRPG
jgi:hypothetical protein